MTTSKIYIHTDKVPLLITAINMSFFFSNSYSCNWAFVITNYNNWQFIYFLNGSLFYFLSLQDIFSHYKYRFITYNYIYYYSRQGIFKLIYIITLIKYYCYRKRKIRIIWIHKKYIKKFVCVIGNAIRNLRRIYFYLFSYKKWNLYSEK